MSARVIANVTKTVTIIVKAVGPQGPEADIAAQIVAADPKATPVDADLLGITDSEDSETLKSLSWENNKATLEAYFDTIYKRLITYAFLFDGYDAPGLTYTGGALTVKETTTNKLILTPANVLPSGGTWDGAAWLDAGQARVYLNAPAVTNKCLADYPRPVVEIELSSGQNTIGVFYEISAQSLIDFTTIGAVDNNIGTQFIATGLVTLTAADKLIPTTDGLDTVSEYDGVSAFRNNISNLTLSGDQAATLTVVAIPAVDLEGAVDEHGEPVDLTSYEQTYEGDYLGYELNNSAGGGSAFADTSGQVGNTNIHTLSIMAMSTGLTRMETSNFVSGQTVNINNQPTFERFEVCGATVVPATTMRCIASAGGVMTFLIPNLTETPATMPLMEANTTRAANVNDATWPSSVGAASGAISVTLTPMQTAQTGTIFSNYTDANNYLEIHADATTLYFNKRVAGVGHQSSVAYVLTALAQIDIQAYYDSTGSGIRYRVGAGVWSAYGTDANTDDAVLGLIASTGHINSLNQAYSFIAPAKIYADKATMEGDI